MKKDKKREKRKLTPRLVIARVLIGAGLSLMLLAVGYEAANYPWHILWKSDEEMNAVELPDPPPLAYRPDAVPYTPEEIEEEPDLPAAESLTDFAAGAEDDFIYSVLGYLKIPKLETSVNILDGSTQSHLRLGAGHVRGTPLPDQPGNVCVAGHRVTRVMHPLRHMDKMKSGDLVYIHYNEHVYKYETFSTFVIEARELWVMKPVDGESRMLTLITCHPPGSARQRLILRARLIDVDGLTPEEFFNPKSENEPDTESESEPMPEVPSDPEQTSTPEQTIASETTNAPEVTPDEADGASDQTDAPDVS